MLRSMRYRSRRDSSPKNPKLLQVTAMLGEHANLGSNGGGVADGLGLGTHPSRIGGVAGGGRLAGYGAARRARAARTNDTSPPAQAMAFSEKSVVTRYVVSWSGLWRSRKKPRRASRVTD